MLSAEEAETLVGHAVGGVCPFAVNEGVGVYLDVSLKRFRTVFPACGSSNSAIELTPEELAEYARVLWAGRTCANSPFREDGIYYIFITKNIKVYCNFPL